MDAAHWVVLITAVWIAVIALILLIIGLFRHLRILGAARSVVGNGGGVIGVIPMGAAIPEHISDLCEISGDAAAVATSLLLFLRDGCAPCLELSDALRFHHAVWKASAVDVIVITDDRGAKTFAPLGRTVVDRAGTIARSLNVGGTPLGIRVDRRGIVEAVGVPHTIEAACQLRGEEVEPEQRTVTSAVN